MKIISGDIIEKAVPLSRWVDHMETAILSIEKEGFFTPDRMHVDVQENTLLIMPSVSPEGFATKLVSVFPDFSIILSLCSLPTILAALNPEPNSIPLIAGIENTK